MTPAPPQTPKPLLKPLHRFLYPLAVVLFLAAGVILVVTSLAAGGHRAPAPVTTFSSADSDTFTGSLNAPTSLDGARVSVPSLNIEVPWVGTGAAKNAMSIPAAPTAGWYEQSSKPGAATGTTIFAAHVDFPNQTLTPFGSLAGIKKGAPIFITDDDGTIHQYTTTSLKSYSQQALPAELFTRGGTPTLVLVTCSGKSIQGSSTSAARWGYEENLVVTATLHGS